MGMEGDTFETGGNITCEGSEDVCTCTFAETDTEQEEKYAVEENTFTTTDEVGDTSELS